jgi:F-type H+-transporting ATPase subunit delta
MSTPTIQAYAEAIFSIATAEGALKTVEDELFVIGQMVEGNDELRSALSDPAIPVTRRQSVMEDLLRNKASAATVGAVSLVVGSGHAADLPAIARAVLDKAAASRNKAVAEVRSAVSLTDDQRTRLSAALKASTGKDVEIKVVIDPSVLGGVITQIGDTVIDGSVRHRLQRVRETLG